MTTITTLKDKLTRAQSDFKDALDALKLAREDYKKTGGAYAAAQERQRTIQSKMKVATAEIQEAQSLIKSSLERSHYTTTDAVKSAVQEKAEAQSLLAALSQALREGELPLLDLQMPAAADAQALRDAFRRAHAAYARLKTCEALLHCAEEMSYAMALLGHVPGDAAGEHLIVDDEVLKEKRIEFVWKTLKELAMQRPESAKRPHVLEIGTLDLGLFSDQKFPTPLQFAKLRSEIEERQKSETEPVKH